VFHLQVDDACLSPAYRQAVSRLTQVPSHTLADFQQGLLLAAVLAVPPESAECRISFELRQLVSEDPSRHQLLAQVVYLAAAPPASAMAGYFRTMRIRRGFDNACAACWQPTPDAPPSLAFEVSCRTKTHPHERGAP
jgi:hypothetical protein